MVDRKPAVEIKASLLSNGLSISQSALDNYGPPFIEKRRGYGNQDPLNLRNRTIPQELYILPDRLICAVNVNPNSKWELDFANGKYFIVNYKGLRVEVDFPIRPRFYDEVISTGQKVSQIVTLYGGRTLAVFAYGNCAFFETGNPCHFCSLSQNRKKGTDFEHVVRPKQIEEALVVALNDTTITSQVMINGGNFADLDKNFRYYARLAGKAREVIGRSASTVDLHLIVFPPKNLELIDELQSLGVSIAMNVEVFDPVLFRRYCPGKEKVVGRQHILKALEKAVSILGDGNVYSILVGGLEPIESLENGLNYLAERGVVPVINVLHTDPETPLENYPNPSVEYIIQAGKILQMVYDRYGFKPFYEDCGRNSIDTEAFRALFYSAKIKYYE